MTTTVVNLRHKACDVYIGRSVRRIGLVGSKWGNPFVVGKAGTRDECLRLYREWLMDRPHLLNALPELRGKRLGCWCAPASCHGDILAELANYDPSPRTPETKGRP